MADASATTTEQQNGAPPAAAAGEEEEDILGDAAAAVEAGVKDTVNAFKDLFKTPEQKESNKIFHALDTDNSKTASMEEMNKFVASNQNLWAMISVNLDQPAEVAAKAATRVAMELATGLQGEEALQAELTKDQFYYFRMNYIKDPAGSQEFFHRAIFACFDVDNNNVLDESELDQFLEVFYKSNSVLQGGASRKLPPVDKLRELIVKRFDTDGDRQFSFEEVRRIIVGEEAEAVANEIAEAAAKAEEEERLRKEAEEKAKREAEEKARREAQEKAEREAKEKAEREAEAARKAEEERLAAEAEAARKAEEERLAAEAEAAKKAEEEGGVGFDLMRAASSAFVFGSFEPENKAQSATPKGDSTTNAINDDTFSFAPASSDVEPQRTATHPPQYQQQHQQEFDFFQWLCELFVPPQGPQPIAPGGGQLVLRQKTADFCIIL